jgi:hypothetical protein
MSKEEDEAFTALLEERTRMGAWRASCAQEEGGQENGGQEDEEGSVPAITPGLPQRVFSVQRFRVQGRRGDWARLLGRSPLCWVGAEDLATQPRSPFRGSEFRREEGIRRGSWGAVRSAALAPRISRCSPARPVDSILVARIAATSPPTRCRWEDDCKLPGASGRSWPPPHRPGVGGRMTESYRHGLNSRHLPTDPVSVGG